MTESRNYWEYESQMVGFILTARDWMLGALLVAVILLDLRYMRLPNLLVLAFGILFLGAYSWGLPIDALMWRGGIAVVLLIVGMAANWGNLLGGGDVKILSVLALFIPTNLFLSFALILCWSLVAGILVLLLVRRIWNSTETPWRGLHTGERFPMGLSIGAAGLVFLIWV